MAFEYNAAFNQGTSEPDDLLSPKHYASVRQNGQQMRALPLWAYTSERFWQAEKERIFLPSWNLLERAEIVPNAGDFQTMTLPRHARSIVVRGNDGKVRVFANTCRHRGALVADGKGNCKFFRCPYHFWTYNLDGSLIGAPQLQRAGRQAADRCHQQAASSASSRSRAAPGAASSSSASSPARRRSSSIWASGSRRSPPTSSRTWRVARKVVYDMDANWKCFVENYIDGYHIPYVHKDSLGAWKSERYVRYEARGNEYLVFAVHDGSQLLLPMPGYDGFPAMPQIDADKAARHLLHDAEAGHADDARQ